MGLQDYAPNQVIARTYIDDDESNALKEHAIADLNPESSTASAHETKKVALNGSSGGSRIGGDAMTPSMCYARDFLSNRINAANFDSQSNPQTPPSRADSSKSESNRAIAKMEPGIPGNTSRRQAKEELPDWEVRVSAM